MKLQTVENFFYKRVKVKTDTEYDSFFLQHLDFAFNNKDPLSKNYTLKSIDKMVEYGYVYHQSPENLVFMVGIEDFGNNVFRSESRLFVHPKYRKTFWKSIDNYETVIHQINNHVANCNFIFKSREAKNGAGFRISQRLHPFFRDWVIHGKQIELRYKNNFQWICYRNLKGNAEEHIQYLQCKI